MSTQTETVLAAFDSLRLVRLSPSGDVVITDGKASSVGLNEDEVATIVADPVVMTTATLEANQ